MGRLSYYVYKNRISKEKTKKLGKKSISDVIHNTPEFNFYEKLHYIRHHYTYYEGNYEVFHDENGKPTKRKHELNSLIVSVIKGKNDPSVLKDFNRQILKWRKEYDEEKAKENESILDRFSDVVVQWKIDLGANDGSAQHFVTLINEFLSSPKNNLSESSRRRLPYKTIKSLAIYWKEHKTEDFDYEAEVLKRQTQTTIDVENNIKRKEERKAKHAEELAQKRVEKLMREYAKDLGYLKEETDEKAE